MLSFNESARPKVLLRELTPADEPALKAFECAIHYQPHTAIAEEMVHKLPAEIRAKAHTVLGLFDDVGTLVGVVAWRKDKVDPTLWSSTVLAVGNGHKNQGNGKRLKEAMLDRARREGARAVASEVDKRNLAMVSLNQKLGALIAQDPQDPDWWVCTILV